MLRGKKAQVAIYVGYIIIMCVSLLGCDGYGLSSGCTLSQRLSYPIFHQNIFHALINLYVLRQCLRFLPCDIGNFFIFYLIAVSYPLPSALPIVGLSGLVYAYMGFIAPYVERKARYHLTILIYISVGIIFPCMALGVHIYCYVLGLLWGYLNAPLCQDK